MNPTNNDCWVCVRLVYLFEHASGTQRLSADLALVLKAHLTRRSWKRELSDRGLYFTKISTSISNSWIFLCMYHWTSYKRPRNTILFCKYITALMSAILNACRLIFIFFVDVSMLTSAAVNILTPADVNMLSSADLSMLTSADVNILTSADVDMSTSADVNISTSADVNILTAAAYMSRRIHIGGRRAATIYVLTSVYLC